MYAVQTNIEHLYHKILPQLTNEIAQLGKVIKSLNSTIGQQSNKIKDIENEIDLLEVDSDGLSHLAQRFNEINSQLGELYGHVYQINNNIDAISRYYDERCNDNQIAIDNLSTSVNTKIDQLSRDVDNKVEQTSFEDVWTTVNTKADQTFVDDLVTMVSTKAELSVVNDLIMTVNDKANQTRVENLSSTVDSLSATVNNKVNYTDFEELTLTVANKAEQSVIDELTTAVENKVEQSDFNSLHSNFGSFQDSINSSIGEINTISASLASLEQSHNNLTTTVNNKADRNEIESLRTAVNEISIVQEQRNRICQIFPTPKEECYGYYDDSTGEFVCKNSNDGNIKKAEILCITSVRKNNGLWKSYCESLNNLTEDETPMLKTLIFAGDDFVMNDIIYYAAASIPRYIETLTEIHVNIRFGKTAAYSSDIGMFYSLLCLRSALEAQSQGYQKIKVFIHKYAGSLGANGQDRYFSNLKTLFWLQSANTIEEITSTTTSQYHGVEWSFEVVNH